MVCPFLAACIGRGFRANLRVVMALGFAPENQKAPLSLPEGGAFAFNPSALTMRRVHA
jgi:hypothetical protein